MSIVFTYYGHATYQLDIGEHTILIDPFFTSNPLTEVDPGTLSPDLILLTHGHFDHVEDAVSIAKRTGAKVVANFEIANWLQQQGLGEDQVHPQHIGGGFDHGIAHVKLTIAHHGSGLPDGTYGGQPAGLLIRARDKTLYFAGDTALTLDMQLIRKYQVDLAVLPIGDNFTMGPEDALEAVRLIQPGQVVPCHYNTWPPIEQDGEAWCRTVESETGASAHALAPGQTLEL